MATKARHAEMLKSKSKAEVLLLDRPLARLWIERSYLMTVGKRQTAVTITAKRAFRTIDDLIDADLFRAVKSTADTRVVKLTKEAIRIMDEQFARFYSPETLVAADLSDANAVALVGSPKSSGKIEVSPVATKKKAAKRTARKTAPGKSTTTSRKRSKKRAV